MPGVNMDPTSRSQGKVIVRKGTADDYEGVLDMDPNHTIYKGNDYLPAEYFRFLNDPDRTITVYLLDGKIVAMNVMYVVDGETAIIGNSARTHTSYRGHGVWSRFKKSGFEDIIKNKDRIGGVTATFWNQESKLNLLIFGRPHLLCKRILSRFKFDCAIVEDVQTLYDSKRGHRTGKLTPDESFTILQDKHTQWRLFPSKRIVVDAGFVPYQLMTDNFKKIIRNSKSVIATRDIQRECKSISFGDGRSTHNGYQYTVNYYGSDETDVSNAVDHVRIHLPIAVRHCSRGPLMFRIVLSNTMSEPMVREGISRLKGCIEIQARETLFVFERNRQQNASKL